MPLTYVPRYEAAFGRLIAMRSITVQVTRGGEPSVSDKNVYFLDPSTREELTAIRVNGVSPATEVFVASAVDLPWLVLTDDPTPPRKMDARYLSINTDTALLVDITDGEGSGGGLPASMEAAVTVSDMPSQRAVVAVEQKSDGQWRLAGSAVTDTEGAAQLDLRVTGAGRVYALAIDDWGVMFQPGLPVSVGTAVRPTLFGGWLYRVTEAGTLPAVEPLWWAAEGDNPSRPLGTARAIAIRYYRPLAHGPVPVTLL